MNLTDRRVVREMYTKKKLRMLFYSIFGGKKSKILMRTGSSVLIVHRFSSKIHPKGLTFRTRKS